jgi:hypothetical protein
VSQQGVQVLLGVWICACPNLSITLLRSPAGEQPGGVGVGLSGERPAMRARMSQRGADARPGLGRRLEVDPMVGGVLRFVDSGFWGGA